MANKPVQQCEEIRDQFTDYLIETLDEAARSEVQQHLIGCSACRAEAESLKTIWTRLGSIPGEQSGSGARARFEVMLAAYQHGLDHAPAKNWWRNLNAWMAGWWPSQPAVQMGLCAALLLLGVALGQQFRQPVAVQPEGEITELRGEVRDMRNILAISLMQQQSASERLRGVNWSYQIAQPNVDLLNALLDTLKHDGNVNVRIAAIDALRQFGERQMVRQGIVQAVQAQDSPIVQMELIGLLVELQEKAGLDTLRKLSVDQAANEDVRKRAQWGIEQLE
jgi:hypothetical protein